jgi:DNA cross-link repair 1A protein
MFFFKFRDGTTILHTGDFRASCEMESEPIFWNHQLDTIMLDTTYLSSKYRFCQQSESINRAMEIVAAHKLKFIGENFLIICGGYLIGKEKIWTNIARGFNLKVWAEPNRKKALLAINDADMVEFLVNNPEDADIHVLPMQHLFYDVNYAYYIEYNNLMVFFVDFRIW